MILWSLESAALALSIFVTVMLLWLGLTVWLNGERGQSVVHLSAAGLLAAALFFLSLFSTGLYEIAMPATTGGSLHNAASYGGISQRPVQVAGP